MQSEDEYDFLSKLLTWNAIQGAPWCWYASSSAVPDDPRTKPWLVRKWLGGDDAVEEGVWMWDTPVIDDWTGIKLRNRTVIPGIKAGPSGSERTPGFSKWLRGEPNDNSGRKTGEDCMVFEGDEQFSQLLRKHRDVLAPVPVHKQTSELLLGWNDVPCAGVSAPSLLKFDLVPKKTDSVPKKTDSAPKKTSGSRQNQW
jgi:hypothetical protein